MPLVKFNLPDEDAPAKEWRKAALRAKGTPHWRKFYNAYMNSLAWSNKRVEVFDEKGMRCLLKREGCYGIADQVHHKSYRHIGDEPLKDLVPVCQNCHESIHE